MNDDHKEAVVFLAHAVKQLTYGFERLDEVAESAADGSTMKAFYMNAIYNHIAAFYLLYDKQRKVTGAFRYALRQLDQEDLLGPIDEILARPMGTITVGEVIRVFRNKVIVHSGYGDSDLDRIYEAVDMELPENQARLQDALAEICLESASLAINLAEAAGIPRRDLGLGDD